MPAVQATAQCGGLTGLASALEVQLWLKATRGIRKDASLTFGVGYVLLNCFF